MKDGYDWEIRTRILFYTALCIALVFMMQHSVIWNLPDFIEFILKYIVLIISLIRLVAVLPLYTKKQVLLILSFFPIIGLVGIKTGNLNYVFLPFIFCLISKGLYLKDIIKCYFIFCCILVIGTFLCFHMGMLENVVLFREDKVRNSFGFIYATDFAAHIFYLVLMCFYLKSGKFNLIETVFFLLLAFVIIEQCDARLDSICIVAIIFCSTYINITKKRNSYLKIYKYIFPFSALLIILLTYLYSIGSDIILLIDIFLSGRLALGFNALISKGIPLLGQQYIQYGTGSGIYYNFIDSSYLVLLIIYGIVFFLLVMYVHVCICSHCILTKNRVLLYVLFMIAINSMIEQHFIEFAYNPFYMAFSAKLTKPT